jgi:hypothetical protein
VVRAGHFAARELGHAFVADDDAALARTNEQPMFSREPSATWAPHGQTIQPSSAFLSDSAQLTHRAALNIMLPVNVTIRFS